MRRINPHTPYAVVISAAAWGGLGSVETERFRAVQAWLEQEAQALAQQESGAERTRGVRVVAGLALSFEADPVARRLSLLGATEA